MKKFFTVILSIGLVMSMNVTVMADTLQQLKDKKAAAVKQRQEFMDSYKEKADKVQNLEISIQELDAKIEDLMSTIKDNKSNLEECSANIEKAQQDVAEAETALENQQELLDKRIRAMYKNGNSGYLEVILNSEGFTDLLARVDAVNKMVSFDKKVIEEMNQKKTDLEDKKKNLEEEKARIEKIKSSNESQKSELDEAKKQQKILIEQNKEQMNVFDQKVDEYYNIISNLNSQIKKKEAEIRNSQKKPKSRGDINYSTDEVVQYALKFRGIPYQWGGNTPDEGFDCSGFVRYVYAHFGVYLPRTSYTQINVGTPVSRDDLQPGDLVFFGSGSPHHVGLYIGEDSYIHAPQTGDVVKISPLTRSDYLGARRVK